MELEGFGGARGWGSGRRCERGYPERGKSWFGCLCPVG